MAVPSSNPTTGLGVAARVKVDSNAVALSLAGTNTHQITVTIADVSGAETPGTSFTLTSCANASAGTTAYTGTITGGGSNAFAGESFIVSGFVTNAVNNGTFICTASSATVLTLDNAAGIAETHAATALGEGLTDAKIVFLSRNTNQATVSSTGLITGVAAGVAIIEVCYPTFDNTLGTGPDTTYAEKIEAKITVTVGP